jgi:hypothetical protein
MIPVSERRREGGSRVVSSSALWVPKVNWLEECCGRRGAAAESWRETKARDTGERSGIESWMAARLGYRRRIGLDDALRVHEESEHDVGLNLEFVQLWRILDGGLRVDQYRRVVL